MVKNEQQLCYSFQDLVVKMVPFCEGTKRYINTVSMPIVQYGVVGDPLTGLAISYNASDLNTGEESLGSFGVTWAN